MDPLEECSRVPCSYLYAYAHTEECWCAFPSFSIFPRLNGTTHQVVTGVVILLKPKGGAKLSERVFHVTTDVCFATLSEEIIQAYVDSGEPMYIHVDGGILYLYLLYLLYMYIYTCLPLPCSISLPYSLLPSLPPSSLFLLFSPPFLPPSLGPSLLSPCVQGQSRSVSNGTHHISMVTFVSLSAISTCRAAHFSIIRRV